MEKFIINSRRLEKKLTFYLSYSSGYIFVDLNGKSDISGCQICKGGKLKGKAIICYDIDQFPKVCRNWLKNYFAINQ